MWILFSFHDLVFPILALKQIVDTARPEILTQQFFMLGLIPGTNIQLTFESIIIICWATIFGLFIYKIYPLAQKLAASIDPYPNLPPKINYFDLIAL
ncbi:MAG: hypothetical protein WCP03_00560 [Candidatus Saccharibacteria bacterium]